MKLFYRILNVVLCAALLLASCSKKGDTTPPVTPPVDTTSPPPATPFDINAINDTYGNLSAFAYYTKWGVYNVHDPSIFKDGDWYYCYSTDVAYGTAVRAGIQIRKSKDLVEWQFVGWVFSGIPAKGANYISSNGGTPNDGLWAPEIVKTGNEYRLYYSLASNKARVSCIGLATASSPAGPWIEKDLVVVSTDGYAGTNAIDPTIVTTPAGDQWMVYGSAWDGLYEVKLNAATGLTAASGDRGKRIVRRGITNNLYNGNLEGAELIYNADKQMYYLFVAYDWLESKYNVRVFRSQNPDGPFLDYNGNDADNQADNGPMIIAPYKFDNHAGWQGVSHCTVFNDGSGQYFIAHQGRPVVDKFYMDLHVRKLFWTADNWPVASPERYAWEDNSTVAKDSIIGNWERIVLNYNVVPGYGNEQVSPDLQFATSLNIDAAGTLNGDAASTWTYNAPWLQMNWSTGAVEKVYVQNGRDWENKKNTIIFTGLNNAGVAIWGKKNN